LVWLNQGISKGLSKIFPKCRLLGKTQMLTDLTTYKKVEAVDATPQDLPTVLRWAGDMCFLAGPATLD
jgi:hypothetical protein